MRSIYLFLALFPILAWVGCDAGEQTGEVTLRGTITNAASLGGLPVRGATITAEAVEDLQPGVAADLRTPFTTTTDAEGAYRLVVPAGTYRITIARPGYPSRSLTRTLDDDAEIDDVLTGAARVEGSILDALTGRPLDGIAGVRVVFAFQDDLSDPNPLDAQPDIEVGASEAGLFTLQDAPFGTFVCIIYVPNYLPGVVRDVEFAPTGTTTLAPSPVTTPPPPGAYRVVLTWGINPGDLDSHLTGPDGSSGRFHIFFGAPQFGNNNLDVDDTDGFGPETTTLYPTVDGVYRFSVFNYDDQSTNGVLGVAGQEQGGVPAKVEVYSESGLQRTYVAPPATSGQGNTWRVFELTRTGNALAFTGNTPGGIDYRDVSGSGAAGEFLTMPTKQAHH